MTIENDYSFICFLLAFLGFDKVCTILNQSLTSQFSGLEFIPIKVLNSFVKNKDPMFDFGVSCHWF